jgi:serine/threonine-protein kinase GIN4
MEPNSSSHSYVHAISDQVLSDKLQFIQEIGFGNWGSVWLCQPKREEEGQHKIAVKLVHRSKTKTTAARVKSLWNEMKVVKALSADGSKPHPSIIPFHSFIMTPSYAMITMEHLPTLIPVEVDESISKTWFNSLLSAIEFCHSKGIVHNDIKPANILLSRAQIPVLVDFGFAEKYDRDAPHAFHSNLSYGTPEYLSPERARGHPHDTRKSDVWSLGISIFEILVGRTPFESSDGEQFTTKEDLEKYWERTVKGKWIGPYKMSRSLENLLRKMLCPNADTRYTASNACNDVYWCTTSPAGSISSHKRTSSASVNAKTETLNTISAKITSPWSKARSSRTSSTVDMHSTASVASAPVVKRPWDGSSANSSDKAIKRHVSRPDIRATKLQPKRQIDLSPIKASPPATPRANAIQKENRRAASPLAHRTHGRSQSELKIDTEKDKRRVSMIRNGSPVESRPSSPLNPSRQLHPTSSQPESTGMRNHPVTASAKKNLPPIPQPSPAKAALSPSNRHYRQESIDRRRSAVGGRGVLMDLTDLNRHVENVRVRRENEKKDKRRESSLFSSVRSKSGKENPTPVKSPRYMSADKSHASNATKADTSMGSVRQRVMEWEREKERLREMQRLEEIERERDGHVVTDSEVPTETETEEESEAELASEAEDVQNHPVQRRVSSHSIFRPAISSGFESRADTLPTPTETTASFAFEHVAAPNTQDGITPGTSFSASAGPLSGFKHRYRQSISKVGDIVRSSSIQGNHGPSTKKTRASFDTMSFDMMDDVIDDALRTGETSRSGTPAESDTSEDRLMVWMKNVENIVEDARQNFASTSLVNTSLPPLPLPVGPSRSKQNSNTSYRPQDVQALNTSTNTNASRRSSRLPRKALAASEIFAVEGQSLVVNTSNDTPLTSPLSPSFAANRSKGADVGDITTADDIFDASFFKSRALPELHFDFAPEERKDVVDFDLMDTPRRSRRVTVSVGDAEDLLSGSPRKRRESRTRSQGDLLQRKITPVDTLEKELDRLNKPITSPPNRLSAVFDRSLFVAPRSPAQSTGVDEIPQPSPGGQRTPGSTHTPIANRTFMDDLNSSPYVVDPYPQRSVTLNESSILDSPSQRRIESVYDRFLMATTSVRRVGKGYQSETIGAGPISSAPSNTYSSSRAFYSTKRPMPPPVSSDDLMERKQTPKFVDEMGIMSGEQGTGNSYIPVKGEGRHTVAIVRRAFKAIVHPKTVNRRVTAVPA